MIRMCIGIHDNNCTNVAEYDSLLCEACEREYTIACNKAKNASRKPHKAADGVLIESERNDREKA